MLLGSDTRDVGNEVHSTANFGLLQRGATNSEPPLFCFRPQTSLQPLPKNALELNVDLVPDGWDDSGIGVVPSIDRAVDGYIVVNDHVVIAALGANPDEI